MSINGFFDTTIQTLGKVLELRSLKARGITGNIANSETPGYSPVRMDFEDSLRQVVSGPESGQARTHPGHLPAAGGEAISGFEAGFYREPDRSGIGDRNNVSVDQEMVKLSENRIRYEASIQMLGKKFNMLKSAIRERA